MLLYLHNSMNVIINMQKTYNNKLNEMKLNFVRIFKNHPIVGWLIASSTSIHIRIAIFLFKMCNIIQLYFYLYAYYYQQYPCTCPCGIYNVLGYTMLAFKKVYTICICFIIVSVYLLCTASCVMTCVPYVSVYFHAYLLIINI